MWAPTAADARNRGPVCVNYFLDTNAVIALLKNQPAGVRGRLRRVVSRGASIAVSSVVLYELWYGVARSERRRDNAERLRIFLSGKIDVVPFDEQDAVTAGDLRATLEAAGTPIGPYDLLIAAQALRSRATLVTANISEFARVRGLVWQDWTAAA
jgi:tRNA(fMet)-specific endonuclease VapC